MLEEKLLESEYVFVDTSVYQKNNFNFMTPEMASLKNFLDEDISLLLTTVTVREIKKHIYEKVKESQSALQSFRKKASILRNSDEYSESGIFTAIDVESMRDELVAKFQDFVDESKAEVVFINGDVAERIFDNFFSALPPFSREKPKEFSDAFILETLVEKSKAIGAPIYVVSLDKDMEQFCASHPELIFIEGLPDYLEIVSRTVMEAPSRKAAIALSSALIGFQIQVSDYLDTVGFEVDAAPGSRVEVNSAVVKNIVQKNELVYVVEEDMVGAGVDYDFEIWTIETHINDFIPPDPSVRTSDVVERVRCEKKYKKTLEVGLTIDLSAEDPSLASIEDIEPSFQDGDALVNPFETVVIDRAIVPRTG